MQRRKLPSLSMLLLVFGLSFQSVAQQILMPAPSPLAKISQSFGLGEINVEYSRPLMRGRTIFGDLVPYGKVWRTGANSTTKITFTDDVVIENQTVKAGVYGIYTIPKEQSWEVLFYSDLTLGGNVSAFDKSKVLYSFTVKSVKIPVKIESFTINIGDVNPTNAFIELMWESTFVRLSISTSIDDRVMKSIEESMKSSKPAYFQAAKYYLENGKDLKKALNWINAAVKENPSAFYMMYTKAEIEYKMGDKAAGLNSAKLTIDLSKKAKSADYEAKAIKLIEANK
jgi:hypothetical protein